MKNIIKYLISVMVLVAIISSPVYAKEDKPDKPDKITIVIGDEVRGTEGDLFTWTYAREAYGWTQNEGKLISYILVWQFNKISELQKQVDDLTERVEALEGKK